MNIDLRNAREVLAYRKLRELLVAKPVGLWSLSPKDTVISAMRLMAEKNIGLVVVLEEGKLVGVISERDCVRRALLAGYPLDSTTISSFMIPDVVTVGLQDTYADCLRLMHQHQIRHLPVVDAGRVIAVISIRDLLREAVTINAKIIAELEMERLSFMTSMV